MNGTIKSPAPSYVVQTIKIADIKIGDGRRAINPGKVDELVKSISLLGLQTPITVRTAKMKASGEIKEFLVAGLHRLEAMKKLGFNKAPCYVISGSKRHS